MPVGMRASAPGIGVPTLGWTRRRPGTRAGALCLALAMVPACRTRPNAPHRPDPPPDGDGSPSGTVLLVGGIPELVALRDGRIHSVGQEVADARRIDVTGRWIVPSFVDSHVHLAYLPLADDLADGGVGAAVDLGSPLDFLATSGPVELLRAGPFVTGIGGYPTRGWGAGGYGVECADAEAAVAAVDRQADLGSAVLKLALADDRDLAPEARRAAAARAHERGLRVAAHALTDEGARAAAGDGADVLAHTPLEPLSADTVAAWSDKAVISTLAAFGGSRDAVENLAALHRAGATILYGTDFGNRQVAGIDAGEIALLLDAGLTPAEILAAGTSAPAAWWGLPHLGAIEPGNAANLLVLTADPLRDPGALADPERVFLRGEPRR